MKTTMRNRLLAMIVAAGGCLAGVSHAQAGESMPAMGVERFVPAANWTPQTNVELRYDANSSGNEILFRDLARWGEGDNVALAQAQDLVIARFAKGQITRSVDLDEVRGVLEGAGVNVSAINFAGAIECKVTRKELPVAADAPTTRPARNVSSTPIDEALLPTTRPDGLGPRSLKDMLVADLAERVGVSPEDIQIHFGEDKTPFLCEPQYKFTVAYKRFKALGELSWDVTMTGPDGKAKRQTVNGVARAWQRQIVAVKPMSTRQSIREDDVVEKRVLSDRLPEEHPLTIEQVVGQEAARDISPGTVMTPRLVEAVQLARIGQLIGISVEMGSIRMRTVAEARESGVYGQSIKVRKPNTRDEFSVVLVGPQEARLTGVPR